MCQIVQIFCLQFVWGLSDGVFPKLKSEKSGKEKKQRQQQQKGFDFFL